jgi:3-keto-disaccharide hydrolase/Dockerin type I domain
MSMSICGRWPAVALTAAATLVAAGSAAADYLPLFNGTDLSGWHRVGGNGAYRVENGEIVGSSVSNTPNTFLVTDREYSDFILELDFKIFNTGFNSGIQLRSHSLPSHNNGQLFGYQVEIDPSTRAWTGGLYFEGGSPNRAAGWLDDLSDNAAARAAFVLGQWNHFRIVSQGRRIKTWINGVPAADYVDSSINAFLPSGVIGLQVHSNSSPTPLEVRWRNLLIREGPPGDYNADGVVDAADYVVWRQTLNQTVSLPGEGADGDLNGVVGATDYPIWASNFGRSLNPGGHAFGQSAGPEPGGLCLATLAGLALACACRRWVPRADTVSVPVAACPVATR